MLRLVQTMVVVAAGYLVAELGGLDHPHTAPAYLLCTGVLLAVGLYASAYGIDLRAAREHLRIVALAVTVGVVCKAALIACVMMLAFDNPAYLVLGVVVAQIDPLSVAALMGDERMSPRAKTILAVWSSFDDPVTVLLALYTPGLAAMAAGTDAGAGLRGSGPDLGGYVDGLVLNLVAAGVTYLVWRTIDRWLVAACACLAVLLCYVALGVFLALAVWHFLMLGVAIVALFLRPALGRVIGWATAAALAGAGVLTGMLLVDGVNVWAGVVLGCAAFGAQVVVGFALTRGLPRVDRVHLAFAQQNGITAIVLALLLEVERPGTVAIVAPAILTVHVLHFGTNWLVDRHHARVAKPGSVTEGADSTMER